MRRRIRDAERRHLRPGFDYFPSVCFHGGVDGRGPVTNTCGADAAPGAGGAGGHASGGEGGGASCATDLRNDAPVSPVRFHSGDRPADALGAGGVIVDGVYDLVSTDIYRSSDANPSSTVVTTIRISNSGTRMEYVTGNDASDGGGGSGGGNIASTNVLRLATSGTQLTGTSNCGLDDNEDYTATSTRLMLSNPLYVKRYVKR